jgi:hypothetical protein
MHASPPREIAPTPPPREPEDSMFDESEAPTKTNKQSMLREKTPSEFPTLKPSQIRAPLPDDPSEAAMDPRVSALRELYAAGDADAALFIAETIDSTPTGFLSREAETVPPPPEEEESAEVLRVPHVVKTAEEIAALPIDHRAMFMLQHIDGHATMEEIFDVCAMPENDAVMLLRDLVELGVVILAAPRPRR